MPGRSPSRARAHKHSPNSPTWLNPVSIDLSFKMVSPQLELAQWATQQYQAGPQCGGVVISPVRLGHGFRPDLGLDLATSTLSRARIRLLTLVARVQADVSAIAKSVPTVAHPSSDRSGQWLPLRAGRTPDPRLTGTITRFRQFTDYYYQTFDADRNGLAPLYVRPPGSAPPRSLTQKVAS